MVTWHIKWCDPFCATLFFCLALEICHQGGGGRTGPGGESSMGVACRPSVGLWCKRACERPPCDTPPALRQELRHRQLTVALELNAATHAVIGLVFETRPSSRRTSCFLVLFVLYNCCLWNYPELKEHYNSSLLLLFLSLLLILLWPLKNVHSPTVLGFSPLWCHKGDRFFGAFCNT